MRSQLNRVPLSQLELSQVLDQVPHSKLEVLWKSLLHRQVRFDPSAFLVSFCSTVMSIVPESSPPSSGQGAESSTPSRSIPSAIDERFRVTGFDITCTYLVHRTDMCIDLEMDLKETLHRLEPLVAHAKLLTDQINSLKRRYTIPMFSQFVSQLR